MIGTITYCLPYNQCKNPLASWDGKLINYQVSYIEYNITGVHERCNELQFLNNRSGQMHLKKRETKCLFVRILITARMIEGVLFKWLTSPQYLASYRMVGLCHRLSIGEEEGIVDDAKALTMRLQVLERELSGSHVETKPLQHLHHRKRPVILWGSHHKTGTYLAQKIFSLICSRMDWCCQFMQTR